VCIYLGHVGPPLHVAEPIQFFTAQLQLPECGVSLPFSRTNYKDSNDKDSVTLSCRWWCLCGGGSSVVVFVVVGGVIMVMMYWL